MQHPTHATFTHLFEQVHLTRLHILKSEGLHGRRTINLDALYGTGAILVVEMKTDHAHLGGRPPHHAGHSGLRVGIENHVFIHLDKELGATVRDHALRRRAEWRDIADDLDMEWTALLSIHGRLTGRIRRIVDREDIDGRVDVV